LVRVRDGKPYTKRHDFWASLCRANIVGIISRGAPSYAVKEVELTPWGRLVLEHELKGVREDFAHWGEPARTGQ